MTPLLCSGTLQGSILLCQRNVPIDTNPGHFALKKLETPRGEPGGV